MPSTPLTQPGSPPPPPSRRDQPCGQPLQFNLVQAAAYVRHRSPEELRAHFGSFLTLLHQARAGPELTLPAVELIEALQPWPARWGYWREWEAELRWAAEILARAQQWERQAALQAQRFELLLEMGQVEPALQLGQQTLALARAHRFLAVIGQVGGTLIYVLRRQGRAAESEQLYHTLMAELTAAAGQPPSPAWDWQRAWIHLQLSYALHLRTQGHLDQALETVTAAWCQASTLTPPDGHLLALAYQYRGTIHWSRGEYEPAAANIRQAITLMLAIGDEFGALHLRSLLALIDLGASALPEAETLLKEVIPQRRRLGATWTLMRDWATLALVYLLQGRCALALLCVEHQLTLATQCDETFEIYRARTNRAMIYLALGRDDHEVLEALFSGLAYFTKQQIISLVFAYQVSLSQYYARVGSWRAAEAAALAALRTGEAAHMPVMIALAQRRLADCRPPAERAALLRQVLAAAQRYHRRIEEADCLLTLASLAETPTEREQLWAAGVQRLTELGAQAWVEDATPDHPPCIPGLL